MNNLLKKNHFKTTIENTFDFYRCSPIAPRKYSQFLQQLHNTNKNITHNIDIHFPTTTITTMQRKNTI
jgi:hypothetical protein